MHKFYRLTAPIQRETVLAFEKWFKAVSKKEFHTDSHIRDIFSEVVKAARKGKYYDLPIEYSKKNRHLTYGEVWKDLIGV